MTRLTFGDEEEEETKEEEGSFSCIFIQKASQFTVAFHNHYLIQF